MIDHIVCWIGMTNDYLWHASNLRAQLQPVVTAHDQDRRRVKAERTGSVSKMAAQTRKASRMTVRAGSMSCIAVRAQTASRTPVADGINVVATVTTDSPWNPTPSHQAAAVELHTVDPIHHRGTTHQRSSHRSGTADLWFWSAVMIRCRTSINHAIFLGMWFVGFKSQLISSNFRSQHFWNEIHTISTYPITTCRFVLLEMRLQRFQESISTNPISELQFQ
jgi:hypothetical protein